MIYHYSVELPRVFRIVSLATNIIIMLFFESIFYTLTSPDNGTCQSFTTQGDCVNEPSPYSENQSLCSWDPIDDNCRYIQPKSSITIVLYVALFSAVVSIPIAIGCNWIIVNVLAAPTAHPNDEVVANEDKISALASLSKSHKNLVGYFKSSRKLSTRMLNSESSSRRIVVDVMDEVDPSQYSFANAKSSKLVKKTQNVSLLELSSLSIHLQKHRRTLISEKDRHEFDGMVTNDCLSLSMS